MTRDLPTVATLRALSPERRALVLDGMDDDDLLALHATWPFWSRPEQDPPPGDWRVWLLMAGRGFGKTRAGAEWVRGIVEACGRARVALVGATMAQARGVMVEGDSGLLAVASPDNRPVWEPSLNRLRWRNGAVAMLHSASEPEGLRGPQFTHAWCDEIAKWPFGLATWDNLAMALRLGDFPRAVATTTPRPVPLVRTLMARPGIRVTRGRTIDNRENLAADFLAAMEETYAGTRLGRQELEGELIEEAEGALWSRDLIERCRVRAAPELVRVVIGVDPPAGASASSDACGIVVVGLDAHGHGHVIEDASVQGLTPEGWAGAVAAAAARHGADRVSVRSSASVTRWISR